MAFEVMLFTVYFHSDATSSVFEGSIVEQPTHLKVVVKPHTVNSTKCHRQPDRHLSVILFDVVNYSVLCSSLIYLVHVSLGSYAAP